MSDSVPRPDAAGELQALAGLLEPVVSRLPALDLEAPDAGRTLATALPADGELLAPAREAAFRGAAEGWLLPKERGGVRFGRIAKDLGGFSVDAVLMGSAPGPRHRHPGGEVDLCWALSGAPRFDGQPPGWVVYPPGSEHVPTVTGGEMLILYFLPGGAFELC